MVKIGKIFLVIAFIAAIYSCQKSSNNQNVQSNCTVQQAMSTQVNYTILNGSGQFFPLNTIGGYVYIPNVGVRGILVYRATANQFIALERSCTKDGCNNTKALVWMQGGNSCKDSICGSSFSATDGSVQSGPAIVPLYQYHTAWDGNQLHIYN